MSYRIPAAQRRRTETPNGVMTTMASPTQGQTEALSLWSVEMASGAGGPVHRFDSEQVWTLLEGNARWVIDGAPVDLVAGDTVVLPAGAERQVTASSAVRAVVCGYGTAAVSVPREESSRGVPPWIS